MGRIGDAIFRGLVSGTARGLEDCIAAPLNVESKVENVAGQHLPGLNGSPSYTDGETRVPVGYRREVSRESSVGAMPIISVARARVPVGHRNVPVIINRSEPSSAPVNATTSFPANSKPIDSKEPSVPVDIKPVEIPAVPPAILATPSSLPSFDEMKNGIKAALMDARKETGLDGTNGKKVHLDDIVTSARRSILVKSGARHDGEIIKYGHTASLAQRNVATFIHTVAPHVNAHLAAEVILVEAAGSGSSHMCVAWAAEAALKNLDQQNRGVQAMLDQNGEVIYSSTGKSHSPSILANANSDHDHDNVEANPYSPMGSPGGSLTFDRDNEIRQAELTQSSELSSESNQNIDSVGGNDSSSDFNLWDAGISTGKAALHAGQAYIEMQTGHPLLALADSLEFAQNIVDLGDQIIQNLPPGSPLDFVAPPGVDCDGPVFPHTP